MKVGIGIPTYNRCQSLERTIESIKKYARVDYELFVAIDGSTDGTGPMVRHYRIPCEWQERQGVCAAKNRILSHFRDKDYIFIVEDDVRIVKAGLFALYIKAIEVFDIPHWNFLAPWQRHPTKPNLEKDGLTMMFSNDLGSALSVYTREVIEKIGGFNPKFKGYGYGHCEYTLRASRAGLTTGWQEFAHLVDAEEYVEIAQMPTVTQDKRAVTERTKNLLILRKTHADKSLIYIPLEEPCPTLV